MKKIKNAKLNLKIETIKQLDITELNQVAGGLSLTCGTCNWTTSHNCISRVVECPATYTCPTVSDNCVTTTC